MGLRKKQENSPLFKHVSEVHNGENVNFRMHTVKKHFSAFSRLVHEAVMIERTSKVNEFSIMNSKGEWGRSHLPRLKLDDSETNSKESLVANNFSDQEKGERSGSMMKRSQVRLVKGLR